METFARKGPCLLGTSSQERMGTLLLFAATIVVAVSILLDGSPAKVTNGLAGLLWFGSATVLVLYAWRSDRRGSVWLAAIALTAAVAFVAKPTDFAMAVLGFGIAGALVAWFAGRNYLLWAKVIVAIYLPMHIGTAILKAVVQEMRGDGASLRTDPPPTAAIVPLVMLLAAMAGAWIVARMQTGRDKSSSTVAMER